MWKTLNSGEFVSVGDKIRFTSIYPCKPEDRFKVVKTEPHYFQIEPASKQIPMDEMRRKVVKYYEIGYYLKLEVWKK